MMIKLSVILGVIGVALLLLSVAPPRTMTAAMPTITSLTSAPAASARDDIAYGKALFSAKGCVTCHHHSAVPGSGFASGSDVPDLTAYRWNADYLRSWLKDPAAIKPGTPMPNLELKSDEIEALIAFLSTGK
jgi:cytochrome c